MTTKRKTNPDHKMGKPVMGFSVSCSCGWSSSTFYGVGARGQAIQDWHCHREKCEKSA